MTRTMTVTQLSRYIKGVFDDEELLHDVTLSGEVAEVSYSDKHTYVVLADGDHSVRCVRFYARDAIEKGVRVALHGSVKYYDKRNGITFAYDGYTVCGAGDKNAKLAAVKEKLQKLGYFENRPQLPKYILNVAAITSPDGAAIRDLLRVISDKCPFVRVRVYPVKVQGEGAAQGMTRAIAAVGKLDFDAIVLCRGGGSDEDLDCFNDERLATAVAVSRIPIVSAIGHEVDYTLCDFCAGTRAGTPSMAGEIVNAHALAVIGDLTSLIARAGEVVNAKFDSMRTVTARLAARVERAASDNVGRYENGLRLMAKKAAYSIERKLAARHAEIRAQASGLKRTSAMLVEKKSARCLKLKAVLEALDPMRIIKTGYAAASVAGKRVKGVADISKGDKLELVFADGIAEAAVTAISPRKE